MSSSTPIVRVLLSCAFLGCGGCPSPEQRSAPADTAPPAVVDATPAIDGDRGDGGAAVSAPSGGDAAADTGPMDAAPQTGADAGVRGFFPEGRPYKTGRLRVSKIHELYWELYGNPKGVPVIVLHGGPGGRAGPYMRKFFDPERWNVLLFDQRGAGRSRPRAEWRDNTTELLVEDMDTLRAAVGFPEKAVLFGGSWGSTLAVAYAEAHPEKVSGMVLRGVFLASKAEIDHFYHGGAEPFYPDAFARLQKVVPRPAERTYPAQLFEMITKGDARTRKRAIDGWARYEIRMVRVTMTDEEADRIVRDHDMTAFSTLENHYMMNGCFLEEGQLLRDAHRIAQIPTYIVNGRYDTICPPSTATALARRLKRVHLEIVPGAAHSSRDPALREALLRGLDWVARARLRS